MQLFPIDDFLCTSDLAALIQTEGSRAYFADHRATSTARPNGSTGKAREPSLGRTRRSAKEEGVEPSVLPNRLGRTIRSTKKGMVEPSVLQNRLGRTIRSTENGMVEPSVLPTNLGRTTARTGRQKHPFYQQIWVGPAVLPRMGW